MNLSVPRIARDNVDIRTTLRSLAESMSPPEVLRQAEESSSTGDLPIWKALVEGGWTGLCLPEAQGGGGAGFSDAQLVLFELGRAGAPVPYRSTVYTGFFLAREASDSADAQAIVAQMAEGAVWTSGVLEHGRDHDLAMEASAGRLTGSKDFIPDAAAAAGLLIAANHSATEVGWYAASCEADGLEITDLRGFGPDPTFAVRLSDTPAELVHVAEWSSVDRWRLLWQLVEVSWATGLMARLLEIATEHALTRHQFKRPIGQFQAVQHRLANSVIQTQGCVHLARSCAFDIDELGLSHPQASFSADLAYRAAKNAARIVVADAHQVLGGLGYTLEHDLQLFSRRLKAFSVGGQRLTDVGERIAAQSYPTTERIGA